MLNILGVGHCWQDIVGIKQLLVWGHGLLKSVLRSVEDVPCQAVSLHSGLVCIWKGTCCHLLEKAAQPAHDLCIRSPSALGGCLISPVDASQHRTYTGIVATANKMACLYAAGFCREHPAVRWGQLHP